MAVITRSRGLTPPLAGRAQTPTFVPLRTLCAASHFRADAVRGEMAPQLEIVTELWLFK